MASREKKSGGDFVLESRHLVGLFFLLVVIFGVVFTLGYLLGRSQYDSAGLRAAVGKPADAEPPVAPAASAKSKETSPKMWKRCRRKEIPIGISNIPPSQTRPKTICSRRPEAVAPAKSPATPKHRPENSCAQYLPKPEVVPAKSEDACRNCLRPSMNAPLIPKGNIMLQVAALQRQEDALELAQALQQKKFPAIVITPGADKYYRVQVGPYADAKAATIARQDLEAKGFKSIVKR